MYAVGDGVDTVFRKHVAGDLAVSLGDSVHVMTKRERQIGHVELDALAHDLAQVTVRVFLTQDALEHVDQEQILEIEIEDGLYPGDYLVPVGEAIKAKYGDTLLDKPEADWLDEVRDFATEAMMDLIREDLAAIGVKMDVFYSEKSLYGTGRIEAAIEELKKKGLIYKGTLEPPKGKMPEDWEPREQTLFRSTAHGDDVDRPIMKSDGSWTYFAPDIAYHKDKLDRGFDLLIDVLGADQK